MAARERYDVYQALRARRVYYREREEGSGLLHSPFAAHQHAEHDGSAELRRREVQFGQHRFVLPPGFKEFCLRKRLLV